MYEKVFYATHPDMMAGASNEQLYDRYVVDALFAPDAVRLSYLHQERLVVGGAAPTTRALTLPALSAPPSQAGAPFLANRELGVVNVGEGLGGVRVDDQVFELQPLDALYVPRGSREVMFEPGQGGAARYYLASTPAHAAYPIRRVGRAETTPLERGSAETSNERSIHQLITPGVCASAQLLLGLTILKPGSVWNTMPPHLHDRRSEAYFYFRLPQDGRVFHMMGQPPGLRQIVLENEQAVICPPWSIHMGAGTSSYAFIWAMGGENLDYDDVSQIDICQLR